LVVYTIALNYGVHKSRTAVHILIKFM